MIKQEDPQHIEKITSPLSPDFFVAAKLGRVVTSDRRFIPQMPKSGVTSHSFSLVFLDGWKKLFPMFHLLFL